MDRRQFLVGASTAAVGGLAGCSEISGGGETTSSLIEIKDSDLRVNDADEVVITGSAENIAGSEVQGATVVAELLDADGNPLIEDEQEYPRAALGDLGTVGAGETVIFEIDTEQESEDDIDEYELSIGPGTTVA